MAPPEDDRQSVESCDRNSVISVNSTIASTTSLASRLANLTMIDFERHGHLESFDFPPVYEAEEAQEGADSEEEVVQISEEALMRELDSIEAPLQVRRVRCVLPHSGHTATPWHEE